MQKLESAKPYYSSSSLKFKFKKTDTTLAHYTIQAGSCLPARTEGPGVPKPKLGHQLEWKVTL